MLLIFLWIREVHSVTMSNFKSNEVTGTFSIASFVFNFLHSIHVFQAVYDNININSWIYSFNIMVYWEFIWTLFDCPSCFYCINNSRRFQNFRGNILKNWLIHFCQLKLISANIFNKIKIMNIPKHRYI